MRIHDLLFSASLCSPCLACPCICRNNSHSSLISISLFQHLIFQRHVTTFQICQDQIFSSVMYSDFQQSKSFPLPAEEIFQNKPSAIFGNFFPLSSSKMDTDKNSKYFAPLNKCVFFSHKALMKIQEGEGSYRVRAVAIKPRRTICRILELKKQCFLFIYPT